MRFLEQSAQFRIDNNELKLYLVAIDVYFFRFYPENFLFTFERYILLLFFSEGGEMRSVLNIGLVLLMSLAFVSCAQPPEQELKAAEDALARAQSAEADVYATEVYRSAKNALDDAKSKVEKSDYEGAKASAIRAKELADQATTQAGTNKEKMRNEAQAMINRASASIADARAALGNAPRGKGADGDLDQLHSDLAQAETMLGNARNNLGSGKFIDALEQARTAESKLSPVQGAVQTAMQKIEDWKEKNKAWYLR